MSIEIIFAAVPFDKNSVTLALESGVDAILTEKEFVADIKALGRTKVLDTAGVTMIELKSSDDELLAVQALGKGETVILKHGWEIIPVENILAQEKELGVEVASLDQARVAAGILEIGVKKVFVLPQAAAELKQIVQELKLSQGEINLEKATIVDVKPAGLGHRVCIDTMSLLKPGQGMLIGNTSAFNFLVHAETESNPYVAPRPFRINAGGVHSYAMLPGDKTAYLEELAPGREVMIVGADGQTSLAVVGRAKIEIRPMLHIVAKTDTSTGHIFLQNAETIRLVRPDGSSVSVVTLTPGDEILVKTDQAGRHFGMRIQEEIKE